MKTARVVLLLSLVVVAACTTREAEQLWFLAGNVPMDYEHGGHRGERWLTSKANRTPEGFGTIMQTIRADPYRGKRMRLRASVRAEHVEQWAGVWMRIDGKDRASLGFDNMQRRAIRGTSGWHDYTIVLDVPPQAEELSFGILLAGRGKVWIDDVRLDSAGNTPTTSAHSPVAPAPVKLQRK